jgi:hypothetical protein
MAFTIEFSPDSRNHLIVAVGQKSHNQLRIGGEEIEL